jgi:hypothetical protein
MDKKQILKLIQKIKSGQISEEEAVEKIASFPFENIGFAMIDHHRVIRWGFPEIIFCQGKTPEQVRDIAVKIRDNGSDILATRAHEEIWKSVRAAIPDARYNSIARTILLQQQERPLLPGKVFIVTAGTADLPVAEESLECARALRLDVDLLADIGVSGIHRLFGHRDLLQTASALIVVAGMEGALPSVVAGLVRCPVIAVPTSVGYGASFGGIAALLAMLNSCVPGIAVMNIDNGLGAAFLAFRILSTASGISDERK